MKNPVYEQIQARKVKARLRMLQHAQRVSGNVSQTCRFFGVSRALFYIWKQRYEKHGVAGLRDLPRRPHHIKFRIPPEITASRAATSAFKCALGPTVSRKPPIETNPSTLLSSLRSSFPLISPLICRSGPG